MGKEWTKNNPERMKALVRKHYLENKPKWKERKLVARKRIRDLLRLVKSAPCMDCGQKYPYYVMDLDHRDPSTKETNPARLVSIGSFRKAQEEIAKCDVVCANCHRARTFAHLDTTEEY